VPPHRKGEKRTKRAGGKNEQALGHQHAKAASETRNKGLTGPSTINTPTTAPTRREEKKVSVTRNGRGMRVETLKLKKRYRNPRERAEIERGNTGKKRTEMPNRGNG